MTTIHLFAKINVVKLGVTTAKTAKGLKYLIAKIMGALAF